MCEETGLVDWVVVPEGSLLFESMSNSPLEVFAEDGEASREEYKVRLEKYLSLKEDELPSFFDHGNFPYWVDTHVLLAVSSALGHNQSPRHYLCCSHVGHVQTIRGSADSRVLCYFPSHSDFVGSFKARALQRAIWQFTSSCNRELRDIDKYEPFEDQE